jgi:hypothetical protein
MSNVEKFRQELAELIAKYADQDEDEEVVEYESVDYFGKETTGRYKIFKVHDLSETGYFMVSDLCSAGYAQMLFAATHLMHKKAQKEA